VIDEAHHFRSPGERHEVDDGSIEVDYDRQGGILPAVLRRLARESGAN
jgi:hypothetical protein